MPFKTTPPAEPSFDFALLRQPARKPPSRNRLALLWLLGLLMLLAGLVVTLVLYLNNFEAEEEQRRRAADAQWLEQSAQFHFRRLEDDLVVLARQAVLGNGKGAANGTGAADAAGGAGTAARATATVQGGLLWRAPGVVLSHGWLPAGDTRELQAGPTRWQPDWSDHPLNAQALATMQDITRGLRRAAYAGPMRQPGGRLGDVVWLAVPFFERGQFAGNYLAALSMNQAVQAMVPAWFQLNHTVRLVADEMDASASATPTPPDAQAYRASMNLPGTELFLEVVPMGAQPATVPRMFFLVAILFLIGMLVSLSALRRDFLKRQQVQAQLQAEVALRTAMENSVTIGLRAWDQKGTILYVNEAFCRMVGYASGELLGRRAPLPYWPPEQTDELNLVHRSIIAHGTHDEGVEVQFQHKGGHLIDVLIHEAPLNAASGEQLGWMSSVLDISERKRAQRMAARQQEKLEASGRLVAVGEVASTLAHELNQPLGALSSFANGLLNRLHAGSITLAEMEPVVARMANLAGRAGGIIQHVNAFARRREITRQPLDLAAMLRRLHAASSSQRPLSMVCAPGPVWIEADALLLEHLISNLTGNALDWADQAGRGPQVRVEVDADASAQMAVLVVADSGPGVREEDRADIFNAFISHKEGGMGMGLAICRSIVEAHHGRIDVDRDDALGGARFTVWLPLAEAPPELPPATPTPAPSKPPAAPTQPAPPGFPNAPAPAPATPTSPKERHAPPSRHSHR